MAAPAATGAAVPGPDGHPRHHRLLDAGQWAPRPTAARSPSTPSTSTSRRRAAGRSAGRCLHPVVPGGTSDSASFTVNNDSSWYEYTVTATNLAGESAQSPQSSPAIQAAAPAGPADRRHGERDRAERHDPVHLHRSGRELQADQLHRVRDQRGDRDRHDHRHVHGGQPATPRPSPTRRAARSSTARRDHLRRRMQRRQPVQLMGGPVRPGRPVRADQRRRR